LHQLRQQRVVVELRRARMLTKAAHGASFVSSVSSSLLSGSAPHGVVDSRMLSGFSRPARGRRAT
jgi:hypothetical protein